MLRLIPGILVRCPVVENQELDEIRYKSPCALRGKTLPLRAGTKEVIAVWLAALPGSGRVQFSSIFELLLLRLALEKFDRFVQGC